MGSFCHFLWDPKFPFPLPHVRQGVISMYGELQLFGIDSVFVIMHAPFTKGCGFGINVDLVGKMRVGMKTDLSCWRNRFMLRTRVPPYIAARCVMAGPKTEPPYRDIGGSEDGTALPRLGGSEDGTALPRHRRVRRRNRPTQTWRVRRRTRRTVRRTVGGFTRAGRSGSGCRRGRPRHNAPGRSWTHRPRCGSQFPSL
jgi:hypothetical protein